VTRTPWFSPLASLLVPFVCLFSASSLFAQSARLQPLLAISSDSLPLKDNAQGVLRVHVASLARLDRLEITITASTGVALVRPVPSASFVNVKTGERHDWQVPVRLTLPDVGYVSVAATMTIAGVTERQSAALAVGTMPATPPRVPLGTNEDLKDLTLVKVGGSNAVVRFGQRALIVVTAGDHLGRSKAELLEVGPDRIVLDEAFVGADGRPNRARITIKEGERGGTRILLRPGEEPPPATRIEVNPTPSRPAN
jgi:hypothetical protein